MTRDTSDPEPKLTEYTYTANGRTATEGKANGNTVEFEYYLDGLLKHQLETKADGSTVVSEHAVSWDANGNRTTDVSTTMDADTGVLKDRTHAYSYDPQDRISEVVKTDTSSGSTLATESYVHDAASNVIEQTIDGTTTSYVYDRNRLLTATTAGVTGSYNYDPFGRLDTITSAGDVIERYAYDGFDRIKEHTTLDEAGASESTTYSYDAMDRTTSRTDTTGETTDYSYLGLSGEVLNEQIAGEVQKSYQYSPWGQRLSQVKHNTDGTSEDGYYGYNPHTDVETVTDDTGDTTSTYGYTAYGNNDEAEFTGVDAPEAGTPGDEPYNVYRYSAKRWDAATGTYDMGFRDYSPGINRFLSRDTYTGALADLNLATSPWNNNRYALTNGNPTTMIELDGHKPIGPTDTPQKDREFYEFHGITDGGWRVDQYGGWEYSEVYRLGEETTTVRSPEAVAATGGPTLTKTGVQLADYEVSTAEELIGAGISMLPIIGTAGDLIDCAKGRTEGCLGLATLGLARAAGAAASGIRAIRHGDDAANGADNVVNGTRLGQQLARESADSVFTSSGRLSSGAIADSRQIIPGSRLGNKDLIQRLTSDGSDIADWGKYTTRTHQSPSGDFQVHFYMNRSTGAVDYGYDYKVIFNGAR